MAKRSFSFKYIGERAIEIFNWTSNLNISPHFSGRAAVFYDDSGSMENRFGTRFILYSQTGWFLYLKADSIWNSGYILIRSLPASDLATFIFMTQFDWFVCYEDILERSYNIRFFVIFPKGWIDQRFFEELRYIAIFHIF